MSFPSEFAGLVAEMGVPAPLDNNQVLSSPESYLVSVPPNVQPGEKFPVTIEGKTVMIKCPVDGHAGMMLRVPANVKMTVKLPCGKLGVYWKGKKKAKVSRLEPFSPLREILREGMIVDSLEIDGEQRYTGLNAHRVGELLSQSVDVPNRKLVVIKPVIDDRKIARQRKNVNQVSSSHVVAHGVAVGLEELSFLDCK